MEPPDAILLVGNAPFANRGCEAIVRGTTRILDRALGDRTRFLNASFGDPEAIRLQAADESNRRLRHVALRPKAKLSVDYFTVGLSRLFGGMRVRTPVVPENVTSFSASLHIGGDNYSLDYGLPLKFLALDDWLRRSGAKRVLWGASVGPFTSLPEFETRIAQHLRGFELLVVREHRTFAYLSNLGLSNVVVCADPAFALQPEEIESPEMLPRDFVGLNFSPLTAARATQGDLTKWADVCARTAAQILRKTDLPGLLIPHVTDRYPNNDDFTFMTAVQRRLAEWHLDVPLVASGYNAAQIKGIIGRARLFIGARTHATIAAMSMCVPTLSLAYSMKAWGLNEDVFGHADFCVDVAASDLSGAVSEKVSLLLDSDEQVRDRLHATVPGLVDSAYSAGLHLRSLLHES